MNTKREGEAKPLNLQAKRVKQSRMISKREGEASNAPVPSERVKQVLPPSERVKQNCTTSKREGKKNFFGQ
jgi:hypothetical protein